MIGPETPPHSLGVFPGPRQRYTMWVTDRVKVNIYQRCKTRVFGHNIPSIENIFLFSARYKHRKCKQTGLTSHLFTNLDFIDVALILAF